MAILCVGYEVPSQAIRVISSLKLIRTFITPYFVIASLAKQQIVAQSAKQVVRIVTTLKLVVAVLTVQVIDAAFSIQGINTSATT